MKRSLVAATAAALLLSGCATGETGHLDPGIEPELLGPRSMPVDPGGPVEEPIADTDEESSEAETGAEASRNVGEDDAAGEDDTAGEGDTGSTAQAGDVRSAFERSSGTETWFADVTAVDVEGESVTVTTRLAEGATDALAVCDAALTAAESAGVAEPSVEVRAADGATLSQRDALAGDEGCSTP